MSETPAGLLVAAVDGGRCTDCGACRECCPGLGLRIPRVEGVDPFAGVVVNAYSANAVSSEVRRSGQSGGLVGALLGHLFETGEITAALGVAMPADGSLRPEPILVRDGAGVARTQGSKYCPAPLNAALKGLASEERIAVVGLACQMHGIGKTLDAHRMDPSAVRVRIGLFCDRVLVYSAIDRMARDLGIDATDAVGFEYRSKARAGWPGEVCFTMRGGQRVYGPQELRRGIKEYATPPRCRVCFDKFNTLADISVGDAWHIAESPEGASVALARTQAGERLLAEAAAAGAVALTEIPSEAVFASAGLEPLRRRFVAFSDARRAASLAMPRYEGLESHLGTPDRGERLLARQLSRIGQWVSASASPDQAVGRIGRARAMHSGVRRALHTMSLVSKRMRRS
jgi:coenzyme F420 hydrogenase subunit beta